MTAVPAPGFTSAFAPQDGASDQHDVANDSCHRPPPNDAVSAFATTADRVTGRPPCLSAFGLGERHSRCSTPSARNDSATSRDSSFMKPRVKMQRFGEPVPLYTAPSAEAVAADKSSMPDRSSLSRTPLTTTTSDVLTRSDSSQAQIPDIPRWQHPLSPNQNGPTSTETVNVPACSSALPLPRVVSSSHPGSEMADSLGGGFGSSQSLCSTGGTSLSRCRRKMQSLKRPAFDLTRIEEQQDRDPSFLAEVCNAAECHPISEISSLLCLGTWKDAGDEALLRRFHIKYVLNVAKELHDDNGACRPPTPEGAEGEFISHSIPMRDCHHEKLMQNLDDAFAFIERARREHARVLVHCRRGISRSVAIVVAYLMASEGRTYQDAYEFVRSRRSCVSINLAFQEVLSEYVPDPRWLHTTPASSSTPNIDEEHQGFDDSPQMDGDNTSRDSFTDEVMLLDEETPHLPTAAAPFSPLLHGSRNMCFQTTFDEPSAPTAPSRGSHLGTPFGGRSDKHQAVLPLSPFA